MKIKIASRKSDLARWQSVQVARHLKNSVLQADCEFIFKSSLGDLNLDVPLASMGGRGVFTEDFQADLLNGVCDLVVHSWKDLPVEERPQTKIAMTLKRADVRDLLLVPEVVWRKAQQTGRLEILTSSPRRIYNLKKSLGVLLPHSLEIVFHEVRGNVPTRLTKMRDQGRALILAKAGLDRLLEAEKEAFLEVDYSLKAIVAECRFMVLPLRINPPAAAQGALAVEVLRSQSDLIDGMVQLTDAATESSARREREILKRYGGGCHQKIGVVVLERPYGKILSVQGLTDQGEVLNTWQLETSSPWIKARAEKNIFPRAPQDNSWFEREPRTAQGNLADFEAFLVARSESWPVGFIPRPSQIVWTAGIKTWEKLAAQGVWVQGSFEGLGDDEDPLLYPLVDNPNLQWAKFSHTAATVKPREVLQATYHLTPKSKEASPNLEGITHFYWMSTTSFQRARELYPEVIAAGLHSCGPGSTLKALSQPGVLRQPPKVFIDFDEFLRATHP